MLQLIHVFTGELVSLAETPNKPTCTQFNPE
jgi:hypothetical protein